jgi:hypothetical protein
VLAGVKSIKELDAKKGFTPQQDDDPVPMSGKQVNHLGDPGCGLPVTGWEE